MTYVLERLLSSLCKKLMLSPQIRMKPWFIPVGMQQGGAKGRVYRHEDAVLMPSALPEWVLSNLWLMGGWLVCVNTSVLICKADVIKKGRSSASMCRSGKASTSGL